MLLNHIQPPLYVYPIVYMFILLYPHNMPLNHHLTVLTIIKHGIYAVLQEPPSQDPALKFVLRASMSQCWQAGSNQPSCLLYSRSLASCQLMSVCHGIFMYFWQNPWTTLPAFLAAGSDWLLQSDGWGAIGRCCCQRLGPSQAAFAKSPGLSSSPVTLDDPGSRTWQHGVMEAVDTFRIYKLQLATQSTRWGQTESIGSEVNGHHLPMERTTCFLGKTCKTFIHGPFSIATLDYQRASHVYNDYILPMAAGNLGHDVTSWQSQHRAGSSAVVTSKDEEQATQRQGHWDGNCPGLTLWKSSLLFDSTNIAEYSWKKAWPLDAIGLSIAGYPQLLRFPCQMLGTRGTWSPSCAISETDGHLRPRLRRTCFCWASTFSQMHWLMGGAVGEFLGDYMIT